MSSASSHQSFVRDGTGYEEVYPSSHEDHDSQSEERSPFASSPSSRNEGLEMSDEEGSNEGPDNKDLPIQSVVGPNGLRQFVMLFEWLVNYFTSSIKEKHFKTFRAHYQILDNISVHLPYESKKCYHEGLEGVGVYEQMLKAGLRFPLSSLHHELLQHLGLSVNQVSPNAWRVFITMEVLYGVMLVGARRLTVREFLNCYRSNEIDKSLGMYSFAPKSPLLRLVYETLDSNRLPRR